MNKFNNQFSTQKLREENIEECNCTTGSGEAYLPGLDVPEKKYKGIKEKNDPKDKETKLASGKSKIYAKDKWGWKEAPSIPNRPSKGGFIYKQLYELDASDVDVTWQDIKGKYLRLSQDIQVSHKDATKGESVIKKESKIKILDLPFDDSTKVNILYKNNIFIANPSDIMKKNTLAEESTIEETVSPEDYKIAEKLLQKLKHTNSKLYNAILYILSDIYPHDLRQEFGDELTAAGLNEGFKKEIKHRSKSQQFQEAAKLANRKLQEVNKILEYAAQLKTELFEDEQNTKTSKLLEKVKHNMVSAYGKIKKLN